MSLLLWVNGAVLRPAGLSRAYDLYYVKYGKIRHIGAYCALRDIIGLTVYFHKFTVFCYQSIILIEPPPSNLKKSSKYFLRRPLTTTSTELMD